MEPSVVAPDSANRGRVATGVQRTLNALSRSRFFTGLVERAVFESGLIADLRQVYLYMNDPGVRARVRRRIEAQVTDETRVIIGHSLGSVIA